jgi:hypothetical protein
MSHGGLRDERDVSYMTLRKATGWTGILLPFTLAGVNMLLVSKIILQGSISSYYYTGVRNILVGALCAIGVFLITYAGYDAWDKWLTNAAGVFAIGVAFCPTTPANPSSSARVIGYFHLTFAGLLFSTLAVIALWLFRKTELGTERTQEKKRRDAVYLVCGSAIALCVVLVPVESFVIGAAIARFEPLFWLEATAICAFGVAWLVKGQAVLKDKSHGRQTGATPMSPLRVTRAASSASLR